MHFYLIFTDYVLPAYSSLSSYEAYEALTDKTKLNKRKYQETISPPWQETWSGQVLPYNNELDWIKEFQ